MVARDACPACSSQQFKKNGHIHTGQQNHRGNACGRQFVVHAENRLIAEDQRTLVARLLLENISLHGICRAVGVSLRWLMDFMGGRFEAAPEHLHVQLPERPHDVISRRDMQLREAEGEQAMAVARDGEGDAPDHGVSRRRSQS